MFSMFYKIHTLCVSYNRIRCDLIIAYFFNAFKWMLDRETSAKMREQKKIETMTLWKTNAEAEKRGQKGSIHNIVLYTVDETL